MPAKTQKGRHEAAVKAWEGRSPKQRTATAKKAWATRKANGWVHPSKRDAKKVTSKAKKSTAKKSGSEAAYKAWETRRANAENGKRKAAGRKAAATRKKNGKVTKRDPERITGLDVRIGDHVSKVKAGPFARVSNISDGEHAVSITLSGGKRIRPAYDATLWRVP